MEETKHIRVFTSFSGYDSQCMALDRLAKAHPNFSYELVGWSEIDKYAIQAHNLLYPQYADRNFGDISKIDWVQVPDFDLFTYSFPCFVAGTMVMTKNGLLPIELIATGDDVITHTKEFKKVVTPMVHEYHGKMVKVDAMCCGSIDCTANHRFYIRRRKRVGHLGKRIFLEPEWVEAENLDKNCYLGLPIISEERLPEWGGSIDNRWGHHRQVNKLQPLLDKTEFWYLMGRYIGDGWKRESRSGNAIIICHSQRNTASLLEALDKLGLHYTSYAERTVSKCIICGNELHDFVGRFGYYAHGKRIDYDTMALPKHLLSALLDGWMDSDGYVAADGYKGAKPMEKISTVSKALAYGLVQIVAKVYGMPAKIYFSKRPPKMTIEGRVCNQRDTYQVVWKRTKDIQDKAFCEDGYIWYPIRHLNTYMADSVKVYNMEVADDNSYTANGAIVHNCTDVSIAGLQKGLSEGDGTRSSLLWECRKAIQAKHPKYLLMENVKALVSKKFKPEFFKWLNELEGYGYTNFWQVINAKDCGAPQNRERVFCVSVLNGLIEDYQFPEPTPLDRCIADILEDEVDERYYLSDDAVQGFIRTTEDKSHNHNFEPTDGGGIAKVVRCKAGSRVDDNFIKDAK